MKSLRPRSGNKEVQQLLDEYYEAGWTISMTGSGHWKLTTPNGLASGFCASTPGDRRATQNVRCDLKKVLKLSEERAQKYQPPTPPEEKAYRHAKDEKNMQALTHNPFRHSIPKPLVAPIPRQAPALIEAPEQKPDMNIQTARSKVQEMVAGGKSVQDAATVVTTAFKIVTGFGTEVSKEGLINSAMVPFNAAKQETAKEAKVIQPKPEKAVRKAHTDKEIDEKLSHVRSILTLPFDKQKKLSLILDLLDELL